MQCNGCGDTIENPDGMFTRRGSTQTFCDLCAIIVRDYFLYNDLSERHDLAKEKLGYDQE